MDFCNLKWIMVLLCILIIFTGLYLSFKREHKNIAAGSIDPMDGSGNLKDGSFSFKFAIGLVLIVMGMFGAYFFIQLPGCDQSKTSTIEATDGVKTAPIDQVNKKDSKFIEAFDFYEGRFTWVFKSGKFGLINREGELVTHYEYANVEQFDYTGFAKVKKIDADGKLIDYLIDTSGNQFKVAYNVDDLQYDIVALDLRNIKLDSLPNKIFSQTQLRILLAAGNDTLSKKILPFPKNLFYLKNLQTLALISFGITSLPTEIEKLTNLSSLILINNKNLSNLPPEIGSLTKLETLDLTYNDSLSTLPNEIGNLIGLRNLYLSNNTNLSSLPSEIWNLSNLQNLVISGTKLTNLNSGIEKLSKLKILYLDNNKNLNSVPTEIWYLTSLERLNLYGTNIGNSSPVGIGNLINLTNLNLSNTNISILPSEVRNLTNLTSLYLGGNRNLSKLPTEICNLVQLTELGLSDNNIIFLPEGIGNLTRLNALYLSRTNLRALPSEIKNLTNLTNLYLGHNENLRSLPLEIRELKNLSNLFLNHNKNLSTLPYQKNDMYEKTTLYLEGTPISSQEIKKLRTIFREVHN